MVGVLRRLPGTRFSDARGLIFHVSLEIIEGAYEVAIEILSCELAQLPGFVFGLGNDPRLRGLPLGEQFVYLRFAPDIEPEEDRPCVAVLLAEGRIGEKQAAVAPGDAGDAARLVSPIEGETEGIDIVRGGCVDVGYGNLGDCGGEGHGLRR